MSIKSLSFLFLASLFLAACGGQKPVAIEAIRPADIQVDADIRTILLVDRTQPPEGKEWLKIAEGALTGEMPGEVKAAAQEAINSLRNELQRSPRFEVRTLPERLRGNSFTAAFPPPLDWVLQKQLLDQYQADVLVVLEVMDSDFIVTNGKRRVKRTVGSGENRREIEVDEWYAQGVGNIKLGLRFYDPHKREIIYQQLISETFTWEKAADSKAQAIANLISKSAATRELAAIAGRNYAHKIAPMPVQLRRIFYTRSKKTPALEEGGRLAQVGRWADAVEIWRQAIPGSREKDQGRMAHNIAVAYEVLGDLNQAQRWAQDAFALYGNRNARNYAAQIARRMVDESRVREQMRQ